MFFNDNTTELERHMKKKLCPILLIGFPAPEEGKRDLRRCTEECALYDEANKQCSIETCAEYLPVISGQIDDLVTITGAFTPFEEDENFDYDPNAITSH